MEIKITLFITLLLYSVIISQSFFYMLAMSSVTKNMQAPSYIETRQLLDKHLRPSLSSMYFATLIASIALTAFSITNPSGILFISSVIALCALLADMIITIKGNLPINKIINSWTTGNYPSDWNRFRSKWLAVFSVRQVFNLIGFISLLAGIVFSL